MATISLTLPIAATGVTAGLHATNYTTLQNAINGGLDANNWAGGKIFAPSKFTQEAATVGQAIVWNGSIWAPASPTVAALDKTVPYVYDRVTTFTNADVQNDATEKSIYTKSVAGNDMGTNRMLELLLQGNFLHNNVAGDTLTIRVKFGGTTFYACAADLGAVVGAARVPWGLVVRVANLGATNAQDISLWSGAGRSDATAPTTGIGRVFTPSNTGASADLDGVAGISTSGTIDTTTAQTLDVTVQWSAASANNSWRSRYAVMRLV